MTEKEKMVSGLLYDASDEELVRDRVKARLLFEEFNKTSATESEKRQEIYKKLFGSIGKNLYIEPSFKCDYGYNIELGDNVYINFDCVILDCGKVKIGDGCLIAPQVGIYAATHPVDLNQRLSGLENAEGITIGNNCWIGGHSTILPGTKLGNNVVVASGSVVRGSFPDNVVIGGVPAKIIKNID